MSMSLGGYVFPRIIFFLHRFGRMSTKLCQVISIFAQVSEIVASKLI